MLLVHVVTIQYSTNLQISHILEYLCHNWPEMFSEQLDVQQVFGMCWPRAWKVPSEYRNIAHDDTITSLESIAISGRELATLVITLGYCSTGYRPCLSVSSSRGSARSCTTVRSLSPFCPGLLLCPSQTVRAAAIWK